MAAALFVLAIDSGTSATKIAVVDPAVCGVSASVVVRHPTFEHARFDPERVWLEPVRKGLKRLREGTDGGFLRRVEAIAVTGVMETLVVPGIGGSLYSSRLPDERWVANSAGSGVMAKMLAMQEQEEIVPQDGLLFGSADYLVREMTGARLTDATNCSTLGMAKAGTQSREFDVELLRECGVGQGWIDALPAIQTSAIGSEDGRCLLRLSRAGASKLDIRELTGMPVVHAGGDACAVAVGASQGVVGEAAVHVYFGTTTWVGSTVASERENAECEEMYRLAHAVPGYFVDVASSLSGGSVFTWARDTLLAGGTGKPSYAELDALAVSGVKRVGEEEVWFVPYINGERCPFRDRSARGAYVGISGETSRGDLARATLEGVGFNVRLLLDLWDGTAGGSLEGCSSGSGAVRVTGGGSRSAVFCQVLSDVLERAVEVSGDDSLGGLVGCTGAGLLAAGWGGVGADSVSMVRYEPERRRDFAGWRAACHMVRPRGGP